MAAAVDLAESARLTKSPSCHDSAAHLARAVRGALQPWEPRPGERRAPSVRRGHRPGIVRLWSRAGRATVTDAASDDPVARVVRTWWPATAPTCVRPPSTYADAVLLSRAVDGRRKRCGHGATRTVAAHKFVESTDLGPGDAPMAVVFVVSAAARATTESDCALLDAAAEHTDVVVGVVAKIDVHHAWRDVLAANRDALAAHAPRYAKVPWVGAAAMPELGRGAR